MSTYNRTIYNFKRTSFPSKKKQEQLHSKASSAIEIKNLSVFYNGKPALKDISLMIRSGTITGIIGPNGAGKSSLIKGILGVVNTSKKSSVQIFGDSLTSQQHNVAYVDQRNALDLSFPINVKQTVLLGTYPNLGYFRRPQKEEKDLAISALEKVQMEEFANRQIGELSGGQLQRVFIARALAQEAEIFLLDEPFVGIDAVSEKIIISLLRKMQAEGKTIVIVHHDLHKVKEYFDEVIILDRHLVANGPVESAFTTPNIQKAYGESMGDVMLRGA